MYIKINKKKKDFDASNITIVDREAKFKATDIESALYELYDLIQEYKENGSTTPPETIEKPCTEIIMDYSGDINIEYVDDGVLEIKITPVPLNTTDTLTLNTNDHDFFNASLVKMADNSYRLNITPVTTGAGIFSLSCGDQLISKMIAVEGLNRPRFNIEYSLKNAQLSKTPSTIKDNEMISYNIIKPDNYFINYIEVLAGDRIVTDDVFDEVANTIILSSVTGDVYIEIVALPESTINDPDVTLENYKLKLEKDGFVQYFTPSYTENNYPESSGFTVDYHFVYTESDSDDYYYLTLVTANATSIQTTPFLIDGSVPCCTGWYSLENSEGAAYEFGSYAFPTYTSWDFTCGVARTGVPDNLFQSSLDYFNSAFKALNIYEDSTSLNTITMTSYDDTWLGQCTRHTDHFEIRINEATLEENYGSYDSALNYWISTLVHELGHTLGLRDNAAHLPFIP